MAKLPVGRMKVKGEESAQDASQQMGDMSAQEAKRQMGDMSAQCQGTIGRAGENSAHHEVTSQPREEKERKTIKELTDDGGCARRNEILNDYI